jgi:hypothetical protein
MVKRIMNEEAKMLRYILRSTVLPFWASPNGSVYDLISRSTDLAGLRHLRALVPGFPRDDPVKEPPPRPVRPFPTDVPTPDQHDVPAPEPRDVPPPQPGKDPGSAKPIQHPHDPKPRPTP